MIHMNINIPIRGGGSVNLLEIRVINLLAGGFYNE